MPGLVSLTQFAVRGFADEIAEPTRRRLKIAVACGEAETGGGSRTCLVCSSFEAEEGMDRAVPISILEFSRRINGEEHFDRWFEAEPKSAERGWRFAGRTGRAALAEDTGGNHDGSCSIRYVVDAVAASDRR